MPADSASPANESVSPVAAGDQLPPPQLYDLLIDGPSLQHQQNYLQSLQQQTTDPYAQQQISGILSLLGSIAEQAYDLYGILAIPGPPDVVLAAYLARRITSPVPLRQFIRIAIDAQPPAFDTPASICQYLTQLVGPAEARKLIDAAVQPPPTQQEPVSQEPDVAPQ